ncbi:MAG: sulfur oxidation c-type cytochrome SoxX [Pseudomonadota bacterium]
MKPLISCVLALGMLISGVPAVAAPLITEDMLSADSLPAPLEAALGDPERGRLVFVDRDQGHCVLCHQIDGLDAPFQGDVGPPLNGLGATYDEGEIRLRVAQVRRVYPDSIMPEYYRVEGLHQVGEAWQGKPALSAQQIEDIVAFLTGLD